MAARRMARRMTGVGVAFVLAAGMAVTATTALPAAAQPARPDASGTPGASGATKGGLPVTALSPRLTALTAPGVSAGGVAAQAAAVGLEADGPGSLLRAADGSIVVDVRTDGTAAPAALTATGASIMSTDDASGVVTMAAPPASLAALANVPGVLGVTEELKPGTGAICPSGIMSEGNAQLQANTAKTQFSVDGTGVRVGWWRRAVRRS